MLIVGTVIGAGFCSGREIVSFFGSGVSVAVAPVCGVCMFFICVLFLSIGSRINEKSFDKVNAVLLGKFHTVADIFLLVNNLIVLSAMIAGLNSLLKPVCDFPVWGIAAAALCCVIACKGAKGMLDCNFIVVPVIIISLIAVCSVALGTGIMDTSLGVFRARIFPIGIIYVSMNMMLASTVLTTLGKLSRKQILWGSFLAAFFLTVLLTLIITALNCTGNYDAEMPILEIAETSGKWLYVVLSIVIGISIFTTMLTASGGLIGYMHGKMGGKFFDSSIVVIAGTVLSFLGFTRVVTVFYPVVGILGLIYIIMSIKFLTNERLRVNGKKRRRRLATPFQS